MLGKGDAEKATADYRQVVRLDPDDRANWLDEVESLVWNRLEPPQLRLV